MSHFITAYLPTGEEVELVAGGRTIWAMTVSGFDLYEAYQASDCNNGVSGAGKRMEVSPDVAKIAFQEALAWALAVQNGITPEMAAGDSLNTGQGVAAWKLLGMSLEERLAEIGDPIPAGVTDEDRSAAKAQAASILKELRDHPPDADECERALSSVGMVMDFSWKVYQGTRMGPATMSFY